MKISFKWNKPAAQVAKEATGGDKTLLFMASEAKRLMQPYVPFFGGYLDKNVRVYTEKNQGVVEYEEPYARFQFFGKVMVSTKTGSPWARYGEKKEVTDRDLHYSTFRHPLATSRWDKAMLAAHGDDLTKATEAYIKKGG